MPRFLCGYDLGVTEPPPWTRIALPGLIVVAAFGAYAPALGAGFLAWDDQAYLLTETGWRGLAPSNIAWMFGTISGGHYQPLTWLSWAVDHAVWGLNPAGYHLTNLVLHATSALLLYFLMLALLRAAHGPGLVELHGRVAAAAGALFHAVHPLRVESVAWVTERRDVLCGVFLIASVLAYLRMAREAGPVRWRWYAASIGLLVVSLFCKGWGMTLWVVLLVLDGWPLRRLSWKTALEKVPFAAAGAGAMIVAYVAVTSCCTTVVPSESHGMLERILQAGYGLCFYVVKTIAPVKLAALYLLGEQLWPKPLYVGATAASALVTIVLLLWRRIPALTVAWLAYAITVAPVLGFTQSGFQLVADRYSYFACIPFAALLAGALVQLQAARPAIRNAGLAAVGALLVTLAALTVDQTTVWRSTVSLWTQTVRSQPDNYFAWQALGTAWVKEVDPRMTEAERRAILGEAMAAFDRSVRIAPRFAVVYHDRAIARLMLNDVDGAIRECDRGIELGFRTADIYVNRGLARNFAGDGVGALADFEHAIAIDPGNSAAWRNHGLVLQARGDLAGALVDLNRAIELDPTACAALIARAQIREARAEWGLAADDYGRALPLTPQGPARRAVQEALLRLKAKQ